MSPVSSTLLLKVAPVNVTCGNEADLDHILFCTFVTKVYAVLVSVFTDVLNEALEAHCVMSCANKNWTGSVLCVCDSTVMVLSLVHTHNMSILSIAVVNLNNQGGIQVSLTYK